MHVYSLQACPEDVISVDSIRAAIGVGLVPNIPRQKPEEKTAADEKTGNELLDENSWMFLFYTEYRVFCQYGPMSLLCCRGS